MFDISETKMNMHESIYFRWQMVANAHSSDGAAFCSELLPDFGGVVFVCSHNGQIRRWKQRRNYDSRDGQFVTRTFVCFRCTADCYRAGCREDFHAAVGVVFALGGGSFAHSTRFSVFRNL